MFTSPDSPHGGSGRRFEALALHAASDSRAEQEQERAHILGYAQGYAEGAHAAVAEREEVLARIEAEADAARERQEAEHARAMRALDAAAADLRGRYAPVVDAYHRELLRRAVELASAVVGVSLGEPSGTAGVSLGAFAALERVLSAAPETGRIQIRMHPADAAEVTSQWEELRDDADLRQIDILADSALKRGSARAAYPHGEIDAVLAGAFDRARRALEEGS